MSNTQHSEWKTTYQGATVRGLQPLDNEKPLWVFSTFLRESVMAYPQGTDEDEYQEFMAELNKVWNVCVYFQLNLLYYNNKIGYPERDYRPQQYTRTYPRYHQIIH